MCNCPLIMNGIGGIMPQESVTVRYAMRHGLAPIIRRADEVGELLDLFEHNPDALAEIKSNIRRLQPLKNPRDILERTVDCPLGDVKELRPNSHVGVAFR